MFQHNLLIQQLKIDKPELNFINEMYRFIVSFHFIYIQWKILKQK